jgi:hypothetical protein
MDLANTASWFRPRAARATLLGRGRQAGRRDPSAICQRKHHGRSLGAGQPSTLLRADNPCRCTWSSPTRPHCEGSASPSGAYLPDVGLRELLALAHRPSHDRMTS